MAARDKYLEALENPDARLMLDLIAAAEGVSHGYRTGFGNTQLGSLDDHPRELKEFRQTDGKRKLTSAAGRYQFTSRTWDDAAKKVEANDFSPLNQDLVALYLIDRRGALDDVLAGRFTEAVGKLGKEWAGLPSSNYLQPKKGQQWVDDFIAQRRGIRSDVVREGAKAVSDTLINPVGASLAQLPDKAGGLMALVQALNDKSVAPRNETASAEPKSEAIGYLPNIGAQNSPSALMQVTDLQDQRRTPEVEQRNTWEQEYMADSLDAEADALRQNAVRSFFGEQEVPFIALPKSVEDAINVAIRNL
jgi:muramidase (phage lysozyme)